MSLYTFLSRARRALRRSPRYLAARVVDSARRRMDRPWSKVAPRLFTTARLLRETDTRTVDELWDRQKRQPFFMSPSDRDAWAAAFERTFHDSRAAVLAVADAALRHQFDLLGSGPRDLGDRLPWHTDFKVGRTWDVEYAYAIQYAELDRPTDVKVPWELSRCQHFTALGQAYWLTGDERYAREFVAEVDDWIEGNPLAYGVNWICAMDVALRAVSWIWAFYYFADAAACRSSAFRSRFLRSLFMHGEFIASHLERSDFNGNHYLCDGVGLVFLGVFFRATAKGRQWLAQGRALVVDEIELQTSTDGVDFEQSTAYHRLVLEGFATPYLLMRKAGDPVPPAAWSRLEHMYEFVDAYTKPDGSVPLIGDADDGRIQKLGVQGINDHRYLLSTGAVLFERGDFKRTASRFWEESFWLLGPDGGEAFARMPEQSEAPRSVAFSDGGVFVLRRGDAHVVIDCAEVGMHGRGGHGHNDILSFELWMNGVNWITDCGAYLYTASPEWRNRFRSTECHNTIQIDGEEVNRFVGPLMLWQLHYDAVPFGASLAVQDDSDRFTGGHRGYERLAQPVTVTRDLALDRDGRLVTVRDSLAGRGSHWVVSRFHVDPSVRADVNGGSIRLSRDERTLWFRLGPGGGDVNVAVEDGFVSPSYGVKVASKVIVCSCESTLPLVLTYSFSGRL